jgi:hypothetical protein
MSIEVEGILFFELVPPSLLHGALDKSHAIKEHQDTHEFGSRIDREDKYAML